MMVAFWILGFQLRLVACLEWLTLCPNCGDLPQMLHLAIFHLLCARVNTTRPVFASKPTGMIPWLSYLCKTDGKENANE